MTSKKNAYSSIASMEVQLKRLREKKLKATPTRLAVLDCLTAGHVLLSIDEIVKTINKNKKKKYDWATVFRCIRSFEKAHLIESTRFQDGVIRYEIFEEEAHHHHVICTACHKTQALEFCGLEAEYARLNKMGYANLRHRMEIFGVCKSCQ